MMATASRSSADPLHDPDLWRCIHCGSGTMHVAADGSKLQCGACSHSYAIREGVIESQPEVSSNNKVASDFYNSPLWPKFRFWEWWTFFCNGGERRSRNKVLKYLPTDSNLRLLDVAVGDGVYLPWLRPDWQVVGIDVSQSQLDACKGRIGDRSVQLILGEAEDLPVHDRRFDAALSIGAFNYFNDPEKALREMARAVKPGGTIVVSDEVPNLADRLLVRKLGLPGIERWFVSKVMHLGDDFTRLVEKYREMDVPAIAEKVLPGCHYEKIWMGVGYVFVGKVPE